MTFNALARSLLPCVGTAMRASAPGRATSVHHNPLPSLLDTRAHG
jgi:hypothetical protein